MGPFRSLHNLLFHFFPSLLLLTTPRLSLQFDSSMNRGDSERQILPLLLFGNREPGRFDHVSELRLTREPFDRFDQVLVRVSVGGENVTEWWDHVERVKVVGFCEDRVLNFGKLETREDSPWFEDSVSFGESSVDMGHVANAESDGVKVERVGFDFGQLFGVTQHERDLRGVVVHGLGEAFFPFFEHFRVDVQHLDRQLAISVLLPRVVEDPHGDVAGPACDVETFQTSVRRQLVHVVVFPQPVYAEGHGIVHDIVRGRDRREDPLD